MNQGWVPADVQCRPCSSPSYRYAYFLWFVLIGLAILYAIAHNLGLGGGFLGSAWTKRSIRRTVIRSRGAKKRELANPNAPRGRSVIWPSNAQIFSIAVVGALVAVLCVVGDDYINPYTSTWNLGSSFAKRAGAVEVYQTPPYNISKTWWTSGARFGLIAFALFPLVVLFALKAPPFAILAIRGFMQIHADKLELLHRWTGRIIWLVTTLHVALWTVQLFTNNRGSGDTRKVWFVIWIYDKFIWAVVGYVGMTGLIVCSMKWVRQKFYEVGRIYQGSLTDSNEKPSRPDLLPPAHLLHHRHSARICTSLPAPLVLDCDRSVPLAWRAYLPLHPLWSHQRMVWRSGSQGGDRSWAAVRQSRGSVEQGSGGVRIAEYAARHAVQGQQRDHCARRRGRIRCLCQAAAARSRLRRL